MSTTTIERSRATIQMLRRIVQELHTNGELSRGSRPYRFLQEQFRSTQPEQRLAQTYLAYLNSTRVITDLHEKYKGKQKTVEQSAALVGLKVPEKRRID